MNEVNHSCYIHKCNKCDIALRRKNIVNGSGNLTNRIMLVGESPGYKEDTSGNMFVGYSGDLLFKLLSLVGIYREDVYVTNVIKCKPSTRRSPSSKEISNCKPNLENEIKMINPSIVILLGNVALNSFFNTNNLTISKTKGYIIPYKGMFVYPIYHPSYILNNMHFTTLVKAYVHNFKIIGLLYKWKVNPLVTSKI